MSSAAKSFDFYQWNNTVRRLGKREEKVTKTKTVTIFHVWLLYMKQFVPFLSVFDVIVFAPPGVRIDCHILD